MYELQARLLTLEQELTLHDRDQHLKHGTVVECTVAGLGVARVGGPSPKGGGANLIF